MRLYYNLQLNKKKATNFHIPMGNNATVIEINSDIYIAAISCFLYRSNIIIFFFFLSILYSISSNAILQHHSAKNSIHLKIEMQFHTQMHREIEKIETKNKKKRKLKSFQHMLPLFNRLSATICFQFQLSGFVGLCLPNISY